MISGRPGVGAITILVLFLCDDNDEDDEITVSRPVVRVTNVGTDPIRVHLPRKGNACEIIIETETARRVRGNQ